jgi:hypothetical protein
MNEELDVNSLCARAMIVIKISKDKPKKIPTDPRKLEFDDYYTEP